MVSDEAYAALHAENAALRQRLEALTEQLASAVQRIAELQAKKTPPPAFVKATAAEPTERAPRRKRAPEPNQARQRAAPSVVVAHAITTCPDCGSRLGGVHVGRTRQVGDLPPPPAGVVTEHQVQRGWWSACARWHEAPLDLRGQAFGQGRLGGALPAWWPSCAASCGGPFARSSQRYLADRHGLRVSVGEVVGLLHRVAEHGAPAVQQIQAAARRRTVVHADETGWREAGHNGYVWLLATPEGERYVELPRRRAGAVANDLLGDAFTGVLVSDFDGGDNDTPGGQHQRGFGGTSCATCTSCVRRMPGTSAGWGWVDAGLGGRGPGWTRAWVDAGRALWDQVHDTHTHPPGEPAARERLAQDVLDEVQALGAQFVAQVGHPCRALAGRLWPFQGELLTCVRQLAVPPDNNLAERAIRPLVVVRTISGGTRSPRGSQTRLRLTTLAATWRASGLQPLDEFRRLLQSPLPQI